MFDMNLLWEKFVFASLRKHKPAGTKVLSQSRKRFWKPEKGYSTTIRPDIVMRYGDGEAIVLDTKWKNLHGHKPSSDDLRQMYVYNQYFNATKSALVYPGPYDAPLLGKFYEKDIKQLSESSCSLMPISVNPNINDWQKEIQKKVSGWMR